MRVNGNVPSIDLAGLMSDLSPESVNQLVNNKKNELRKAKGFNAKKEKITLATVANRTEEILQNPDRMSISIADDTNPPYVRCNVNGGDSNAYYFHLEDPTYMYNFKGEPIWSIEKVDPDFYATLFEHYKDQLD